MAEKGRTHLLNFVIDEELLNRLDDYRYEQRFPTRAGAIKYLLSWALKQRPDPTDDDKPLPRSKKSKP